MRKVIVLLEKLVGLAAGYCRNGRDESHEKDTQRVGFFILRLELVDARDAHETSRISGRCVS